MLSHLQEEGLMIVGLVRRQEVPVKCRNHRNLNTDHLNSHTWICFYKESPQPCFFSFCLGWGWGNTVLNTVLDRETGSLAM